MNTIATEFGGTVPHSLNEYYRGGGLVPNAPANSAIPTSGQIAIGDFYGSTNRIPIPLTISANSYNYDVYTNRGPTYVSGASDITVTVNPGVIVGSTSRLTYSMSVPSAFSPGDTITIVNNGVIQGTGGAGGNGGPAPGGAAVAGGTGGSAIYVNRPTVITNNGTVASGGGGGGGGGGRQTNTPTGPKTPPAINNYGGGGGGGGAGFNGGAFGTGGTAGSGNGTPGSVGTSPAGGGGGAGAGGAGAGGAGGGRGAGGSAGAPSTWAGAGGGATGNYIVGNPFVTWPVTGTRQGNVSNNY
jgi:hypothetical protein